MMATANRRRGTAPQSASLLLGRIGLVVFAAWAITRGVGTPTSCHDIGFSGGNGPAG